MTFSIIIAAYNVADYINQAIESCLHQENIETSDYEIIVIDDGSKDSTGNVIDEYRNVPNVKIVHQSNRGLSGTRNRGVEMATGDFIIYLDGDDWLRHDALSKLEPLTKNSDLVVFPMTYWYSNEKTEVKGFGLSKEELSSIDFLKQTIGQQKLNIIPSPCKCYRRKILIDNSQKFVEGILHEDNSYFVDTVMNFNRIRYLNEGIYFYRQNRIGSITSSQTIRNFEGTIKGIEHTISLTNFKSKHLNYLMTCWHTFQAILKYKEESDKKYVYSYYRQPRIKWQIFKMLINSSFIPKQIIRTILLIIDPMVLSKFCDILYGPNRR